MEQNLKEEVFKSICVVGLGYVGLPLAVAFGRTHYPTFGFDISIEKVRALKKCIDLNKELTKEELEGTQVEYSDDPKLIEQADVIIAAVPTPIDDANNPDLTPIMAASKTIGQHIKRGAIVVYESTVYPGLTEEICVPILEKYSGLTFGKDFEVGYSPERINPGDKEHTVQNVKKIVAASTPEALRILSDLYGTVVKAGIHEAPSIKVAEAAKVIENVQRDLNIGLVNELSVIFKKMGINTLDVLEAAETKWNFHKYRPGLVGGHCIGVDPYYLTYKAEKVGHHPQIILAGRRVNDGMAKQVTDYFLQGLILTKRPVYRNKILMLGLTFKENVSDIRNSKAKDVIEILKKSGLDVYAYDPLIEASIIEVVFGVPALESLDTDQRFDGMILFSPHDELIKEMGEVLKLGKDPMVLMDVKSKLQKDIQVRSNILYQTL